ncbi:MAG: hypothetical protein QOG94_788 [Solirubrobacteraceae bacterium]|jgi:hypothetical protein|nr:hypothetical protein [Solirubrobacteraceae bacterium]
MRRTITRTVGLAAAIAASLGVGACPALAGSYVVSACSPTSSPGRWVQTNTFPTALTTGNLCGGPAIGPTEASHEGGLYAEDVLSSSGAIPDGSRAGWTITAPLGATITAISYYRTLHAYNDANMISGLFQADGTPLEQCKIPWPFVHGSSIHCDKVNNQAPATFTGLNTGALFFGVGCRLVVAESSCITGGTIHAASADLYSARVTLSESGAPTLSNVRGPLWDAGAVWGVVPVTFVAGDASGIQEQIVRSDTGQTLVSVPQACDFGNAPPCPQQPAGALNVDTSRVPDGAHAFSLSVTDAAGNSQIATSPTVLVDNNGPPPPTLTATAQGAGSRVIVLSWRNPPSPPAPIVRAMVQLCQATCPPATTISASGAAQLTVPAAGVYSVRLWLIDANGRGGEHHAALATVSVPAAGSTAPTSGSASRTKVVAVIKGRRLRVSGTIMRTGRVRVSWRSRLGKHTLGTGTRVARIREHRIALTFTLSARARRGTTRVAVRSGSRIVAQARARRG